MGSAVCVPRNVDYVTVGTQTEAFNNSSFANKSVPLQDSQKSRSFNIVTNIPFNDSSSVTSPVHEEHKTVLGRKRDSHNDEPKLIYNSSYDLLTDPKCLVPWVEEYSVGIEMIDSHHKVLVRLINDLSESLKEGHMRFEIGSVIDNLVEYTDFHFRKEEDLMERYKYKPMKMTKHKETHRKFVKKIFELREEFRTMKKENIGTETLDFLRDWLLTHILHNDKKMCQFFKEQIEKEKNGLPLDTPDEIEGKLETSAGAEYLENSVAVA